MRTQRKFKQQSAHEMGGGSKGEFKLSCKNCPAHSRIAKVSSRIFNITGLGSYTNWFFNTSVRNNVTKLTGHHFTLVFNFTTKAGGKPTFDLES